MRVLSLCLALVMAALVWLPAQDIYWHPQYPSTDGNEPDNWSTTPTAHVPPVTLDASTNLHFTGVGANVDDCVFTAPLTVTALITYTGFTPAITINADLTLTGNLGLAAGAGAVTLTEDLILVGNATVTAAAGTSLGGTGAFVWRQLNDFPSQNGLTITAPVSIEQADTASTVIALPAWDFGGSLTFVAHADTAGLPDLHVTVLGAVSATDIAFTGLVPSTEIRLFFSAVTSRLTATGDMGASGSGLLVAFEAAGFPITLNADSMSFANPANAVDFVFGVTEAADLSVNTSIDVTSNGSASDDLTLELAGAGDGMGDVSLTLPHHTWNIRKTGAASTVTFQEPASVRSFITQSTGATDIIAATPGMTLTLASGSQLTLADTGSTNGNVRFLIDLALSDLSTHTLTNATGDAILELDNDITTASGGITDVVVNDGHVRISDTDARPGDGVSSRSFTYIDGAGTIVEYLGNGYSIDVVARGDDVQLRGTGQVLSFASESINPVSILPGDDAGMFGILTIDNADLRSAVSASDEVDLVLKISGNYGAGIDYSRLAASEVTVASGRTRFTLDLLDWSQGDATVSGIITYSTAINGDPLALEESMMLPSGVTAALVHDTLNQQIDLIVTVDDGSVTPPPVAGVFRTPSIPVSTRRSTLWTAVCPGTVEGLDDLRTKLTGRDANETRAFTWDPSTQAYVEFPAEPVGGVEPWHGWFIATTVPLRLDFSGTFDGAPHRVPLQAGWNLVGVGPVSDEVDVTRFPLASLELRDGSDAAVTGGDRSAVIGSTIAGWTTDGYRNVADFTSGRAYWVYNADAADHDLVYVAGSLIPVDVIDIDPFSVVPAATIPTPPAPPDLGGAKANADGGSCGGGSGIGFLILLVAFSGLRRQRMLRP